MGRIALCTLNSQLITVPEKEIRELEEGVLLPICDSVEINGECVRFWHHNINEVVLHRIKTAIMSRGFEKLKATCYNQADIVFGGDHGQ
jgi:hypothetical protein